MVISFKLYLNENYVNINFLLRQSTLFYLKNILFEVNYNELKI